MSLFVTGGTGFLGGYVVTELLSRCDDRLALLTRAPDLDAARQKLWRSLQLHMGPEEFHSALDRIDIVRGDLHAPDLGIAPDVRERILAECDSVLHIAASLNRKSAKACLNTNLRGTLSVVRLARAIADRQGGLRRFSYVSTVAVCGKRSSEVVHEDTAIEWDRSDYDPYGRTKKFCEHMVAELLPDVQRTVFRPSIVLGDSRFPQTTQFDMVRALVALADLPVVPISADTRVDIVNADYVGEAIAAVHLDPSPSHSTYHLSSGTRSITAGDIGRAMEPVLGRKMRFVPSLGRPTDLTFRAFNRLPRGNALQAVGALMKVFWPYIVYDTVFDSSRIQEALGKPPVPFTTYCEGLYGFVKGCGFDYPYVEYPS